VQKPDKPIFLIENQAFDYGKITSIPVNKNDTISTGETVFDQKRTLPFWAKTVI